MRQCELKKRYDPDLDAYVTKHIYGEGISDVLKSIGRKIFGKTVNKVAKLQQKRRPQQLVNMLAIRLVIR